MLQEKIAHIQTLLRQQKIDYLVIGNFGHQIKDDLLYYFLLTHLELGVMVIPKKGIPLLHGISFEVDQLSKAYPEIYLIPIVSDGIVLPKDHAKKRIAYRPSSMPNKYVQRDFVTFKDEEKVMAIKSIPEISLLKKATDITDHVFAMAVKQWKFFKTEQDVATYIVLKTIELGAEPSFPPIVASGTRASNPHHHPETKALLKGFCVIDMGVRYQGYCSDMTRTIYIGNPTKKDEDIYENLRRVQEEAITECSIGARISDIAKNCRTRLGEKWNIHFTHALGHGLGTQVHEWPRVSTSVMQTLEEHMYITIEPGIYPPNKFGIRIEDDVLITKRGPKVLTKTSKNLINV